MSKKGVAGTVATGLVGGGAAVALLYKKARSICAKYKENPAKHKACMKDVTHRDVLKKNKQGKRDLKARRSNE